MSLIKTCFCLQLYGMYIQAINYLLCFLLYFRTSIVKQLTEDGTHHLPAHVPEKFQSMEISGKTKLTKQTTIGDLEVTSLNPKVEGRIRLLNSTVSFSRLFFHFHNKKDSSWKHQPDFAIYYNGQLIPKGLLGVFISSKKMNLTVLWYLRSNPKIWN